MFRLGDVAIATITCACIGCLVATVPVVTGFQAPMSKCEPMTLKSVEANELTLPWNTEILSRDPLVYVIPNFLSHDECRSYIERVEHLASHQNRTMTRSNPPEVSIDIKKLWPLPLFSLLAGLPTLYQRDLHPTSFDELRNAMMLRIFSALVLSTIIAVSAVPILQFVSNSSSRTSDAVALNQIEDMEFVRRLVDRVSSVTNQEWSTWEAPVVTRYSPGAIFAKHGDASPTKGSEWKDFGGQRVVTCICYLNTLAETGGETAFDRLGIRVSPTEGSALFFFPADANTWEADDRTVHESLPPLEEKWIVQMFGRGGRRVPPPLGLPDSFRSLPSS